MTMIAPNKRRYDFDDYSRIVDARVIEDTLRVSFADGSDAIVLISAIENAFIQQQELIWARARPSIHEVVIPAANGEEVGLPWDTIRALSDPDFLHYWHEMSHGAAYQLGNGIRSLRTSHGLSVEELARRSNLPVEFIDQIENGEAPADLDVAEHLLSAMNLSLDDLVDKELGI